MARPDYDLKVDDVQHLIGQNVDLDQDRIPMAPCKWCGHKVGNIRPGSAMHKAQVRCNGCDRGLGWLSSQWIRVLLMQRSIQNGGQNASAP